MPHVRLIKLRNMRSRVSRAFTLIELLVSIAIIALLASLLFLGGKAVLGSGNSNSTKVMLAQLQAMLAEYDAKTHLKSPKEWFWLDASGIPTRYVPGPQPGAPISPPNRLDFWYFPYRLTAPIPPSGPLYPDALDSPGPVTADAGEGIRSGARQILNTQMVMNLLMAMPNNRKALEKISPDRYYIPVWQPSTVKLPSPGTDRVLGTSDDTTNESVNYLIGARVTYDSGTGPTRYRAKGPHPIPSSPPTGSAWLPDSGPAVPVFKDAWNNPIIFVPGSGLRVRLLNGQKEYLTDTSADSKAQTWIIVSPEGKTGVAPSGDKIVTTPGRPFFASAGPDGDFSKGDDNIYSFEK